MGTLRHIEAKGWSARARLRVVIEVYRLPVIPQCVIDSFVSTGIQVRSDLSLELMRA